MNSPGMLLSAAHGGQSKIVFAVHDRIDELCRKLSPEFRCEEKVISILFKACNIGRPELSGSLRMGLFMKYSFAALAISAALLASPAFAAGDGPTFENGPVWDYAQVKTKDGHFDDYMKWLSTDWKKQEEALKKAGVILDYKVFLTMDPRDNEPDIFLAQEYKNLAVFDTPQEKQYALQAQIAGSIAKSDQQQAARGSIRTLMGDVLVREAVLK